MEINWLAVLVATLTPTIIGFVWYNPKVMGNVWMKAADMTEEKMKGANMGLIFGLSFVLSFLLAMYMHNIAIHQFNVPGLFNVQGQDPAAGTPEAMFVADFISKYGSLHRTFAHGIVHGLFASFLFVLPIMATNAMFERKNWKYILVNFGYWLITICIMSGIICGWPK